MVPVTRYRATAVLRDHETQGTVSGDPTGKVSSAHKEYSGTFIKDTLRPASFVDREIVFLQKSNNVEQLCPEYLESPLSEVPL